MIQSDYGYVIENVYSKNPDKRTAQHDMIIGKRCVLPGEQVQPCFIGAMIVEPFGKKAWIAGY